MALGRGRFCWRPGEHDLEIETRLRERGAGNTEPASKRPPQAGFWHDAKEASLWGTSIHLEQ